MKKLLKLGKALSKAGQKTIYGGAPPLTLCTVGCAGKNHGAHCYALPNCGCGGQCGNGPGGLECIPF